MFLNNEWKLHFERGSAEHLQKLKKMFVLNVMRLVLVARGHVGLYYFGNEINRPVSTTVQMLDI
jgi:hypothetical protein